MEVVVRDLFGNVRLRFITLFKLGKLCCTTILPLLQFSSQHLLYSSAYYSIMEDCSYSLLQGENFTLLYSSDSNLI